MFSLIPFFLIPLLWATAAADPCRLSASLGAEDLAHQGLSVAFQMEEYQLTSFGYKIHRSCLQKHGPWVLQLAEESIKEGKACLDRLDSNMARQHRKQLDQLIQQNHVQLICNDPNIPADSVGMATVSSENPSANLPLVHPGISIKSSYLDTQAGNGESGSLKFKRTLFHEQMHNLGYRHGREVEYPYACEECCFGGKDTKEAACNLCSRTYQGLTDFNYLKDVSLLGRKTFDTNEAFWANLTFLKSNPGSLDGMAYLAYNLTGSLNPIGWDLAQILKEKNKLSAQQMKIANDTSEHKWRHQAFRQSSQVMAQAFYALYQEGDGEAAIKVIKDNLPMIQKQIGSAQSSAEGDAYTHQRIKEKMKATLIELLEDISLKQYLGQRPSPAKKPELMAISRQLMAELK